MDNTILAITEINEILCKQLQLLAERSKVCEDSALSAITSAMVSLSQEITRH